MQTVEIVSRHGLIFPISSESLHHTLLPLVCVCLFINFTTGNKNFSLNFINRFLFEDKSNGKSNKPCTFLSSDSLQSVRRLFALCNFFFSAVRSTYFPSASQLCSFLFNVCKLKLSKQKVRYVMCYGWMVERLLLKLLHRMFKGIEISEMTR